MKRENFIVENSSTFLEFPIDKDFFYEDKDVINYINEISNFDSLSLKQQDDLIKRKLKGDKDAKDKLIESNLYLAVILASKYSFETSSITNMDLISEANMALMEAIDNYLFSFGNFTKYLKKQINSHLIKVCKIDGKTIPVPITGKENYYDSLKWLNETEERYRILLNMYINDVQLEGGWEYKNHPKFEDMFNPEFSRLQSTRMEKFEMLIKLRKGIESLDTYNYDKIFGEDTTFDLDEIITTRKIQQKVHFAINNLLNDIEKRIIMEYLKENQISYKRLSEELNMPLLTTRKYAASAIRKLKDYLYKELRKDVSYVKRGIF